MIFLEDENPYLVLGLEPGASSAEVTKAFAQKNRGNAQERHRARRAFDALRQKDTRLLADALTPVFDKKVDEMAHFAAGLEADAALEADLLKTTSVRNVLDEALTQTTLAVIAYTTRKATRNMAGDAPAHLEMSQNFNGLEKFVEEWLK